MTSNKPSGSASMNRASPPVSRVLSRAIIHLGRTSPHASSNLPGSSADHAIRSLFGLAPSGVYLADPVARNRGSALTPPFHPYPVQRGGRSIEVCSHSSVHAPSVRGSSGNFGLWREPRLLVLWLPIATRKRSLEPTRFSLSIFLRLESSKLSVGAIAKSHALYIP